MSDQPSGTAALVTCPGCHEQYDRAKNVKMEYERGGVVYCCDEQGEPAPPWLDATDGPASASERLCSCGQPALPNNPFCSPCDMRVLIVAREMFPDAAEKDFEREVPRAD